MLFLLCFGQLSAQQFLPTHQFTSADPNSADFFGYPLAMDGDWAIVGTSGDDTDADGQNALANAGAAYIFTRNGTTGV